MPLRWLLVAALTVAGGLASPSAAGQAAPGKDRKQTPMVEVKEVPIAGAVPGTGRTVRVVSISLGYQPRPLNELVELVDREAGRGADLIALPETCRGEAMESLDGPTITAMRELARRHQTYIVCPIYREHEGRRYNSAVLIDRKGQVVHIYDKVYPYWPEFDLKPRTEVGRDARVYRADFGKVGFAICFDVNFPEVWQRLAEQGAELVIWPSAYSAGTTLQTHALTHHYYIVTSTLARDCIVYDITGEEAHYQKSEDVNVSRLLLDLDRGIYHENYNIEKRDRLLKEHPDDVAQEKYMEREAWFVLRAKRPGVSARAVAREYGLEELRDYIERSRRGIDRIRGRKVGPRPRR